MDPKMDPSELQNLHLAPLESSWERFWLSFLGFRIEAEKWVEKKTSGRSLLGGRHGQAGGGFEGLGIWIHDLTRLFTSSLGR